MEPFDILRLVIHYFILDASMLYLLTLIVLSIEILSRIQGCCRMLEIYHETKSELLNEAFGEPEQPRVERRRSTRQAAQEVDEDEEVDLFL